MDRLTFAPAERPVCSAAGCRRRAHCRGLCEYHYNRARRESYPACAFPGCDRRSHTLRPPLGAAGPGATLCVGHFHQWERRGSQPGDLDGLAPLRPQRQRARAPGDRLTPELRHLPVEGRVTKADYRREFAYGVCAFAGCDRPAETRRPFTHRPGHPDKPGPGVVLCPGHRRQFGECGDLAQLRPLAWRRLSVEPGKHPAKAAKAGKAAEAPFRALAACRTDGCRRPPVGRLDTCRKCYDRARREVGYGETCEAAGCSRPSVTVGPTSGSGARLCAAHASMWQRHGGDPRRLPPVRTFGCPLPPCAYPDCGRPAETRNPSPALDGHLLCPSHAQQYRRARRSSGRTARGDPLALLRPLRSRRGGQPPPQQPQPPQQPHPAGNGRRGPRGPASAGCIVPVCSEPAIGWGACLLHLPWWFPHTPPGPPPAAYWQMKGVQVDDVHQRATESRPGPA